MHVGERLRKARVDKGLTQGELAAPDYSAAYVSVIESGKREPSERVLRHFAKKLGLTYDELATGRPPDAEASFEADLLAARRALSAGDSDQALAGYRRVARRAAQFDLSKVREKALLGEALCREVAGEVAQAEDLYAKLQETIPDEHTALKADAVAGRARCVRILGDVPYSTYLLEGYLAHIERNGLVGPEALIRIHISLVASYFEAGMIRQASDSADKALSLSPRVKDPEKLAAMHINLARVLMERRKYDEAARSFSAAEQIYTELGLEAEVGRAHLARAFLMKKRERLSEARGDLEEALRIFEATGNKVNEARALSELGSLERLSGHIDQAMFMLQRAARMKGVQEPASAAVSYRELALCYAALGDSAKMRSSFKKAADLLESSGDHYELAITYRTLGDALREEKDFEKACDAYRSAAVALEAA